MPIYEYQCQACQHQLEALQKMADAPLTACPVCDKPELKKLVSAAAFRLSGSGWYETDFKTGNKKKNLTECSNGPASVGSSPGGGLGVNAKPDTKEAGKKGSSDNSSSSSSSSNVSSKNSSSKISPTTA